MNNTTAPRTAAAAVMVLHSLMHGVRSQLSHLQAEMASVGNFCGEGRRWSSKQRERGFKADDDYDKLKKNSSTLLVFSTGKRMQIFGMLVLVCIVVVFVHDTFQRSYTQRDEEWRSIRAQGNRKAFNTAQQCLRKSRFAPWLQPKVLIDDTYIPPLNLTEHYEEMLEATAPFRNVTEFVGVGYSGPWIEARWIAKFCCHRPLTEFGGLVPLFVQWNDMAQNTLDKWANTSDFRNFRSKLRRDVLYVTVSQNAAGINPHREEFGFQAGESWNIFVISAGGYGHMPIPLLAKEFDHVAPLKSTHKHLISFAGSIYDWCPARVQMTQVLTEAQSAGVSSTIYKGSDWVDLMTDTAFQLCPRGFGRTSYRLYEVIQLGLIPVYLYNDHEWLPYRGTSAYMREFGYSMHIDDFKTWLEAKASEYGRDPRSLNLEESRAKILPYINSHYTYAGVLEQIEYFLKGDSKCDLSCQPHPRRGGYLADPWYSYWFY